MAIIVKNVKHPINETFFISDLETDIVSTVFQHMGLVPAVRVARAFTGADLRSTVDFVKSLEKTS